MIFIVVIFVVFLALLIAPLIIPLITLIGSLIASFCVFIFNLVTFGSFKKLFQRVYANLEMSSPEDLRLALLEINSKGGVPSLRGISMTGFLLCRLGAVFSVFGILCAVLVYILSYFAQSIARVYALAPAGLTFISLFIFLVGALKVRTARSVSQSILASPLA